MEGEKGTPSKKRFAGRVLSRDNPGLDDDVCPEPEMGTFKRASEEVMAGRRIVKVRRQQPQASSSNPFANISLVAPTKATEKSDSTADKDPAFCEKSIVEEQNSANDNHNKAHKDKSNKHGDTSDGENATEGEAAKSNRNSDKPSPEENDADKRVALSLDDKAPREHQVGDKHEIANESAKNDEGRNEGEAVNKNEGLAIESNRNSDKPAPEENNADERVAFSNEDKAPQDFQGGDTHEIVNEAAKNDEGTNEGEIVNKTTKDDGENDGDETSKEIGEETKEAGEVATGEKQVNDRIDKTEPTACLNSFQQLSSNRNAFSGLAATGFSGSTFSFGPKHRPTFGFSTGSVFGEKSEKSSFPAFGVGGIGHGSSSVQLFGSDASDGSRTGASGTPVMKEMTVETGEENEKVVFNADAILFEYVDGGWKERGKGEIRVNVSMLDDGSARLVMRNKGNYRLILNSSIYPDMSLKNMDKRSVTFACVNGTDEGKCGLTTFAMKFKDGLKMEEFRETVATHKEKIR